MYSPEFTHMQAELSRKMEVFLKEFHSVYFTNIVDDKIERDFLREITEFYNASPEGKSLNEAEKTFESFKGKMM